MKLGGSVVSTQEFATKDSCITAAQYINKHLDSASFNCLPK